MVMWRGGRFDHIGLVEKLDEVVSLHVERNQLSGLLLFRYYRYDEAKVYFEEIDEVLPLWAAGMRPQDSPNLFENIAVEDPIGQTISCASLVCSVRHRKSCDQ
jgi:hypothetical protein